MQDLWRASTNPTDWRDVPLDSVVGTWWALWIFATAVSQTVWRTVGAAETTEELLRLTYIQAGEAAVHIALCVAAIRLVSQIAERLIGHAHGTRPLPYRGPTFE
jgi:hypothetical protein